MNDPLELLADAGAISAGDRHLALALARRAGEAEPWMRVALSLAARAPRYGQVCVQLDQIVSELRADSDCWSPQLDALTWPDAARWRELCGESTLARNSGEQRDCPLVRDGLLLYLDRHFRHEAQVLAQLAARACAPVEPANPQRLRECLAVLFESVEDDASLDRQYLATVVALVQGLAVISGGPGTGKTTTVTKLLAAVVMANDEACPPRIALAAPTGKAAARMQAAISEGLVRLTLPAGVGEQLARLPAFTLHRLLGPRRDNSTRFRHDAHHPLAYDFVIVDEASMISMAMMDRLLSALSPATRLVMLGDRDQLASVDAGAVFGDICRPPDEPLDMSADFIARAGRICSRDLASHINVVGETGMRDCSVQLTKYHRFSADGGIARWTRAIQAMAKDAPALSGPQDDIRSDARGIVDIVSGQDANGEVRLLALDAHDQLPGPAREDIIAAWLPIIRGAHTNAAPARLLEGMDELRVLCPHREGNLGVQALNQQIERWLVRAGLAIHARGDRPHDWYLGRPILVTTNDYGVGLYNGDIGIVVRDPDNAGRNVAAFPGGPDDIGGVRLVALSRVPACTTVYAMSIHKSQGSQFQHAVVVLPPRDSPIMTRELIYTAITRARARVTLIGERGVLLRALSRRVQRPSGLRKRLWADAQPG